MSTASSITVVAEDAPAQATNATIDRPDAQSQRVEPAAGRFKRRRMSTNCECKPSIGYKQRDDIKTTSGERYEVARRGGSE